MDKIKFLKDVEVPNLTAQDNLLIGSELLSRKRLNALLSLINLKTINGVYMINDMNSYELSDGEISDISFTSNGETFSRIRIEHTEDDAIGNQYYLYYDDKNVATQMQGFIGFEFTNKAYKNIIFGTIPQELSDSEYRWFTSITEKAVSLSGIYQFNENISVFDNYNGYAVSFTSNGTSFSKMRGNTTLYYDDTSAYCFHMDSEGNESYEWDNYTYRTVDFGTTEQYVQKSFYDWLIDNATKQVELSSRTWVLNDGFNAEIDYPITFESNSETFERITCDYSYEMDEYNLSYDSTEVFNAASRNWDNEAFKTIRFPYSQIVPKTFYDWLTNNGSKKIIEFSVDTHTYQAEDGMTWEEWYNSDYRTDNFVTCSSSDRMFLSGNWQFSSSNPLKSDVIVAKKYGAYYDKDY
jgi:hypothetical protein